MLHHYGAGFVFLLIALETMGLPLPGETVMIAAALYAARSHAISPVSLLIAASGGAILGGVAGYAIGRGVGSRLLLRYGPRIGLTPSRRLLGQYLMQRNGIALVFFGRFIAVLRALAAVLAGANRMKLRRFMLANVAGGIAWPTLYVLGAYALGRAAMRFAGPASLGIGVLAVIALIGFYRFVRSHEQALTSAALRARDAGELDDLP